MPTLTSVYELPIPALSDLFGSPGQPVAGFKELAEELDDLLQEISYGYKVLPSRRNWDLEFERLKRGLATTNYAPVFAAIFADSDFNVGDTILVRPGTYALTSSVVVAQSVTIEGLGTRETVIFDTSAQIKMFDSEGVDNVTFRNLTFDGPGATTYNASMFGVWAGGPDSAAYAEGLTIENCIFRNISGNCIEAEFQSQIRVRDCYFTNYVRAANMFPSCNYSIVEGNVWDTPTNGTGNPSSNTYHVAFTRNTTVDLVAQPRSRRFVVINNTGFGGNWESIDTHGGEHGFVGYNFIYGVQQPIAIVGSAGSTGDSTFGPKHVTVAYNFMDSQVTNGTFKPGIVIQGAGEITGTPNDYAEGCKAIGNTIIGHGLENTSISCGMLLKYAKGTVVTNNFFKECSPNGIVQDHTTYDSLIADNLFLDIWTEQSVFVNAAICFPSPYGSAFVTSNRLARGIKSVALGFVNRTGIRIDDESPNPNTVVNRGFNDFFSATTPLWDLGVTKGRAAGDDASLITQGTLAVARGGTGIASYTTNNYIRASGATTLEQRTPAQVRSDIGADNAANLTSGIIPSARVNALNNVTTLTASGTTEHTGAVNFHDDVTFGSGAFVESSARMRVTEGDGSGICIATRDLGDTQDRWLVSAEGGLLWGSGSVVGDTNLYRSAANELRTDDSLVVATNLRVAGAAMQEQTSSSTSDQTYATNATARYQTIGFSFVAPPSGKGRIVIYMDIQPSLHVYAFVGWHEIRTGGTIGSGTVTDTGDVESKQFIIQGNATVGVRNAYSVDNPVSGLTPGDTYNATLWGRVGNVAGATANCRSGRISWYPSVTTP